MPPPTGFSSFSRECEDLLFQTKFLSVVSSLGHLYIKNFFEIGPTVLALKLHKGKVLGLEGWPPPHRLF